MNQWHSRNSIPPQGQKLCPTRPGPDLGCQIWSAVNGILVIPGRLTIENKREHQRHNSRASLRQLFLFLFLLARSRSLAHPTATETRSPPTEGADCSGLLSIHTFDPSISYRSLISVAIHLSGTRKLPIPLPLLQLRNLLLFSSFLCLALWNLSPSSIRLQVLALASNEGCWGGWQG